MDEIVPLKQKKMEVPFCSNTQRIFLWRRQRCRIRARTKKKLLKQQIAQIYNNGNNRLQKNKHIRCEQGQNCLRDFPYISYVINSSLLTFTKKIVIAQT